MTAAPAGAPPRRATCPGCARPLRNCLCALARPIAHATEVLILQHPLEVHEAKGTARLLHQCLPHSRLQVGEQFDARQLHAWLEQPWRHRAAVPRTVLLYPESPHDPTLALHPAPALPPTWGQDGQPLRLVVLDGTWRKSRKMLYCNPLLQRLPRLALQQVPASRYLIRRAHRPGQLSTLEATCCALARLEPDNTAIAQVLQAMDALVQRQREWQSPAPRQASAGS